MSNLSLTTADNGSTHQLNVGDSVELTLPENPTTGYRWILTMLDDEAITAEEDDYQRIGDGIGAGGTRKLILRAVSQGTTVVSAELSRIWEPDDPLDRCSVTLIISE